MKATEEALAKERLRQQKECKSLLERCVCVLKSVGRATESLLKFDL